MPDTTPAAPAAREPIIQESGSMHEPPSPQTPRTRRQGVAVVVTLSTEPMDFDTWAASYVRALIAADRAAHAKQRAEAA